MIQGPGENAGVVDIGDGLCATFKIESHNHPSYVEPFQGAATGVGGILRDIFTMGARPIAVLDALRFGPVQPPDPELRLRKQARIGAFLDYGVRARPSGFHGNCFRVFPRWGGRGFFAPCYSGNPLVNALALGIARREELFFARAQRRRPILSFTSDRKLAATAFMVHRCSRRRNFPKNRSRSGQRASG